MEQTGFVMQEGAHAHGRCGRGVARILPHHKRLLHKLVACTRSHWLAKMAATPAPKMTKELGRLTQRPVIVDENLGRRNEPAAAVSPSHYSRRRRGSVPCRLDSARSGAQRQQCRCDKSRESVA